MSQTFIMMMGFSRSGKTTLAKQIEAEFPDKFTRIDADTIHDFLNTTYPVFQDDHTIIGQSFELRQKATKAIREVLIETILESGHSVIMDSTNLANGSRKAVLARVKAIDLKISTIIVSAEIPEAKLYENLRQEDQKNIDRGEKATWVELYEKIQKPKFEKPNRVEADLVLNYTGENIQPIIDALNQLINQ